MNAFDPFLAEPPLLGHEDLLRALERARGQSFLVSGPRPALAEAAGLLARFWLGVGPRDRPASLLTMEDIRMKDVRQAIDEAWIKPVEGRTKALVLHLAARPSREVMNALLRLTEEPPPHLGVFLVTPDPGRLPPTLASRLLPMRLHPLPQDVVSAWLTRLHAVPEGEADLLARRSGGWPWQALALRDAQAPHALDDLRETVGSSPLGFLLGAERAGTDRRGFVQALTLEAEGRLRETRDPRYMKALEALGRASHALDANVNGTLVVENLILDLEDAGVLRGP